MRGNTSLFPFTIPILVVAIREVGSYVHFARLSLVGINATLLGGMYPAAIKIKSQFVKKSKISLCEKNS